MKLTHFVLTIIIVLGFVLHMAVIMPSGSHYCFGNQCGTFFWGAHEHDAVWHLALSNVSYTQTPAVMPDYSGTPLSGYNSLLDGVLHILSVSTHLSVSLLYFKIIPVLWFTLLTYVVIKLSRRISSNPWYPPILLFFVYFGNSFSYFLTLFRTGTILGGSGLLTMQAPQTLTNIQFALSLPLVVSLLLLVHGGKQTFAKQLSVGVITFVLLGLKFYGGAVALSMAGLYYLLSYTQAGLRKTLTGLAILGLFTLGSIWLFYKPSAASAQAIFSFSPMSTVHPIIEDHTLFYLPGIASARYALASYGFGPKLFLIEVMTLVIFIVMNFGTRLVGLFSLWHKARRRTYTVFDGVVMGGVLVSFLLTVLLVQRGVWWNTIQFLYYSFFLFNIYAALVIANLLAQKKTLSIIFAVVLLLLTIPNVFDDWQIFTSFPPRSYVSDEEMTLLSTLAKEPKGVVLALPLNSIEIAPSIKLAPLHDRYDTSYVAAYSGQQTYLNDLVQLQLTGIDYHVREQKVLTNDCSVLNDVRYIYIGGDSHQIDPYALCGVHLSLIQQNDAGSVYRVEK